MPPLRLPLLGREDKRPLLAVAWELMSQPWRQLQAEGKLTHATVGSMVVGSAMDWCIEVSAFVGLISLTSRLFSVWLVVALLVTTLPVLTIM